MRLAIWIGNGQGTMSCHTSVMTSSAPDTIIHTEEVIQTDLSE